MKLIQGVSKPFVWLLVLLSALCISPFSNAGVFTLTNKNSTASIDSGSSTGLFNWVINNTDVMNRQWFWYRVGASGAEQSINALTQLTAGASDADFDGLNDTLFLRYTNSASKFVVEVTFALTGGALGTKTSDIAETIKLKNVGANALDFHFFQYSDFNLNGSANDIVRFMNPGTISQTNALNAAYLNTVVTSSGSHREANVLSGTYTSLTNSTATTLSDANGPMTGDATWANQWDVSIAAGASYTILADHIIVVPEPSSLMLGLVGLLLLAVAVRQTEKRVFARVSSREP